MKSVLRERFRLFGLELNGEKTRIVYCKDADHTEEHSEISFDFLGYTFRPRLAKNKHGSIFLNFLSVLSTIAIKAMKEEVRSRKLQLKILKSLNDLANIFNSQIQHRDIACDCIQFDFLGYTFRPRRSIDTHG